MCKFQKAQIYTNAPFHVADKLEFNQNNPRSWQFTNFYINVPFHVADSLPYGRVAPNFLFHSLSISFHFLFFFASTRILLSCQRSGAHPTNWAQLGCVSAGGSRCWGRSPSPTSAVRRQAPPRFRAVSPQDFSFPCSFSWSVWRCEAGIKFDLRPFL